MKNKLFEVISPIFFWSSMACVVATSLFLISVNYKIIIINSAAAAESDYAPITRTFLDEEPGARNFIDCDCEKKFKKEYPIVWSGKVISTFVSGEDFGVERFNEDAKYRRFYVDGRNMYTGGPGADVKVTGRLIGITCAYANSVFGECVGEVIADDVEVINTKIKKDNK